MLKAHKLEKVERLHTTQHYHNIHLYNVKSHLHNIETRKAQKFVILGACLQCYNTVNFHFDILETEQKNATNRQAYDVIASGKTVLHVKTP